MAYVDIGGDEFTPGDPPHGICIAFDDSALAAEPTWVRIDDPAGYRLASGFSISRGRTGELDKTGTGTASLTCFDRGGVLDPTNAQGPFWNKLNPMKQSSVALWNPITGEWGTLFTGYVSSYNHSLDMWTDDRGLDTVTIELVDGFDLLAAVELTPGDMGTPTAWSDFADVYYPGTPANFKGEAAVWVHVDDRIVQMLDDGRWPNLGLKRGEGLKRNVFSGNVSVQGATYSRRDQLLAALQDCADAEFPGVANLFMSKTGVFTFHGRFARFYPETPDYGINDWKCGSLYQASQDEDCAPIAGLEFRRAKEDIINACTAFPAGADESTAPGQLYKDTDSINEYGWRSQSFDNLLLDEGWDNADNLVESKKYAQYYVENFKAPQNRVTQIKFRPRGEGTVGATALWAMMCGIEIGDRVFLVTEHPGGGGFADYFFVEGVHYEASPMRVDMLDITMTLDVSPAAFYDQNPWAP